MSWKTHINHISNMISRSIGVLNKLKYILPPLIKIMIYNAFILPRINYGLLVWGYENEKIFKLQEKAICIIPLAKCNANTEPLFKTLNLFKINDIFISSELKFFYKFLKNDLPHFFNDMTFSINNQIHYHSTKISSQFHRQRVKHTFAKNCIRYSLPILLHNNRACIKEKTIHTQP